MTRLATGCLCALVAASVLTSAALVRAQEVARLHGRLSVELAGLSLEDAGEVVIFLQSGTGSGGEPEAFATDRELPTVSIRQSGASFEPDFLVVSRGQRIEMPNDDVIYHNVFSYSEPNDFDLGMYAAGESRAVRFEHDGLVRIYCSIHDEMDGLIFVAPSPLFATPGPNGRYAIADIPAGRYTLRVWSERLPGIFAPLELRPGESRRADLALGRADSTH